MRKTFVLDTNVLIYDPGAICKFFGNDVKIPLIVIEELDGMKKARDERGYKAREAIRILDHLKHVGEGDLRTGLKVENDITVQIVMDAQIKEFGFVGLTIKDNVIIATALHLKEKEKKNKVVFVSKDLAARVKAEALGLEAEDYESLKVAFDNLHSGVHNIELSKPDIDLFVKEGSLPFENKECYPNDYFVMRSPGEGPDVIGKYDAEKGRLLSLLKSAQNLWGITPLNVEQCCALDLLLRDDINLVTLVGHAGTGKTLLALAAALRKVFDEGVYTRVLVSRPIVPLGKDIGYLPGTKDEKLRHWMQPIFDNLEFLCDSTGDEPSETLQWIFDSNKIEMEAVTYIRGRSLPKAYIIIDEAQNLTPHEVKTVISRAGKATKVVLTGDPTQIDNPYLDPDSNGLTFTVDRFKEEKLFGHITMRITERSPLAALAAELM
ncbi:PhoH family protein [Simkania negevensis]|uniref:PhoH family protein n=1 Tax=Simkania negevensis TaxID=83561 RepID=A0ABS3AR60_9BACT|nr:PhoH family protein [Simkania negevensis]